MNPSEKAVEFDTEAWIHQYSQKASSEDSLAITEIKSAPKPFSTTQVKISR